MVKQSHNFGVLPRTLFYISTFDDNLNVCDVCGIDFDKIQEIWSSCSFEGLRSLAFWIHVQVNHCCSVSVFATVYTAVIQKN